MTEIKKQKSSNLDKGKRDFIALTTASFAAAGAVFSGIPFIKSMNPSADVLATATKEIDLSGIISGQTAKVMWQGKPVFVRNRTAKEVEEAKDTKISNLRDPQTDEQRTKHNKENWLVVVGICTHLGCVPINNSDGTFFCPCHGSYYDTSGRILKGPAPRNLIVPEYYFINDQSILIGASKKA